MIPLQITANLARPIAVTDNLSPDITGIIEYSVRESTGRLDTNVTFETLTEIELPIKKHELGFYQASSPHYLYSIESTDRYRKRWDYQSEHLDWGKKKAKFSGSDGQFKSYDLPLFLKLTERIDWFVVGDKEQIKLALSTVTHLGKKRSYGFAYVSEWSVKEIDYDWSFEKERRVTRPIPLEMAQQLDLEVHDMMVVAWKTPSWMHQNQVLCYIPKDNVRQIKEKPRLKTNAN